MPGDADGSICVEEIDNLFLSNARYWYRRIVQSAGYRSPRWWSTCYREAQISICDLLETFRSRFDMLRDLGRHLCVGCSSALPRGFDLSEGWIPSLLLVGLSEG